MKKSFSIFKSYYICSLQKKKFWFYLIQKGNVNLQDIKIKLEGQNFPLYRLIKFKKGLGKARGFN